jgi:S1-C subfamily serine protease
MKMKNTFIFMLLVSLTSCSFPGQKATFDTVKKDEVLAKLSSFIDKNGNLTEEDINVSVYSSVNESVVGINTTSIAKRNIFTSNVVKGTGSGVLITKEGHILTNYHVVTGAKTLQVVLSDKSKVNAKLLGGDKEKDVAVIKVDNVNTILNPAPLGNSDDLSVGQKVLAIGSPFGLTGTLTTGIISSLNRSLPAEDGTVLNDIIQTDAAINPGNSGGPLLNSKGEIIGINTAIFSPNGGSVGIGFAVPINKVKEVLKTLSIL